jgi:hypothetical protein
VCTRGAGFLSSPIGSWRGAIKAQDFRQQYTEAGKAGSFLDHSVALFAVQGHGFTMQAVSQLQEVGQACGLCEGGLPIENRCLHVERIVPSAKLLAFKCLPESQTITCGRPSTYGASDEPTKEGSPARPRMRRSSGFGDDLIRC